jgi:hypothetical protein
VVTHTTRRWLILVYKVPPEPTANRVSVWRKLKRLGAILLHDAVWVLPSSPRTEEEFQWLVAEIHERGGDALLWGASLCQDGQDQDLVKQFAAQVDAVYAEVLADLQRPDADLAALSKRYRQARLQDYFRSTLGERVRHALLAAGGRTD